MIFYLAQISQNKAKRQSSNLEDAHEKRAIEILRQDKDTSFLHHYLTLFSCIFFSYNKIRYLKLIYLTRTIE